MTEISPLAESLLKIHKIISRGLNVSIRKCDEYLEKKGITPDEAAGFSMYIASLSRVTHAHHLSEDEIVFPYFKDNIAAPYNRLMDDHIAISRILEKIDRCLPELPAGGTSKLRDVLDEFNKLWGPHITIEEDNFTNKKLQTVVKLKDQVTLIEKLARHGRKHSGPGPLALPFLFYNLEGKDRESFMMPFPWIVKKVLVPIVWKGQWKPMSPFLLCPDPA